MKAMIFAAGLGTRLRPLTNDIPKALVPYKGKPLLQYVIDNLKFYGFNEIMINIHHFPFKMIEYLLKNPEFGKTIHISEEQFELLDTGGGLYNTKDFFQDEPFLVHNVDILSKFDLKKLYNNHLKNNAIATLAVQNRKSSRRLYFNDKKELCKWKNELTGEEKPARNCNKAPTPFAFSGIQVISPEIFNFMKSGVYSIIDTYLLTAKTEKITFYDFSNITWADMGRPENFEINNLI